MPNGEIPPEHLTDVQLLWDYLQLRHELRPADVGIGLGSHDPTVPEVTVDRRGLFPYMANRASTEPEGRERYRGGRPAVHMSSRHRLIAHPWDTRVLAGMSAGLSAETLPRTGRRQPPRPGRDRTGPDTTVTPPGHETAGQGARSSCSEWVRCWWPRRDSNARHPL